MDFVFLILSFIAALISLVMFIKGVSLYISDKGYKKSWQTALMLITVAGVLAILTALMDSSSTLGTGLLITALYAVSTAIAFGVVYAVKKARGESSKGYLRYAAIALFCAIAMLAVSIFVVDDTESPEREAPGASGADEERTVVTVASFIDGDTTRFNFEGNEVSFRYLLIDTPETNHPRIGEQPYGKEASARTKEILSGADTIEVEFDVGPKQDHYERYLAYIYADGKMVNETLVREGLAQVRYINPPNTTHLDRLEKAQEKAKEESLGIWSLDQPFDSEAHQKDEDRGNGDSGTKSQFKNCTELRQVHPDGVKEGHPAYSLKMDGDRDGYACD
ncbi:thermonuclease family protein [Salinicoccus sp. CNSTN-B1]